MKKILFAISILYSLNGFSQLVANVLIPPQGLVQKQQLWNVLVINSNTSTVNLRIQAVLTEVTTGQPVLSATTGIIVISPGTKQLSAANVGPVQFNVLSSDYRIDASPAGLLPVGNFNICYNFLTVEGKTIVQDCQSVYIQPLTPLLLNMPTNGSTLDHVNPTFNWLPLPPAQMLANLTYAIKLVEVYPGQSVADAAQKNIPLFTQRNLNTSNLFYTQNAPALEKNKQYAWQVTAMNNVTEIIKSEAWNFRIADKNNPQVSKPGNVYVKLKKEGEAGGYCVFYGSLRFEYFNETSDTTWNVQLTDISSNNPRKIQLETLDTLKMSLGENLIDIPGRTVPRLTDKHIYALRLTNSRNETWLLKFEYRKEKE